MTFETPSAAWLAALALPVVLLHLHLRRRRSLVVSSVELWRGLVPDGARRGGVRHVRDGLALASVLAALLAFTGSAMGPVTGAAPSQPRRLAIVVDASRSMNTRMPDGRTRFDAAREAALRAIARAAPQDDIVVWTSGEDPRVAVEPTHDAAAASSAVRRLAPTLAAPRIALTTRLAVRAAPGVSRLPATVLVLTDEAGAQSLAGLEAGGVDLAVGVTDAGRVAENAGIAECDVDPADAGRLLVRVLRTDGTSASRTLRCGAASVPLTFDARGEAAASVPFARSGGVVEARLEPSDDFPEDDVARLVVAAPRPLAVAVAADPPSPFLVQALRAMPEVVDPARTTLVRRGAPAAAFEGADAVIADDAEPPPGRPSVVFGAGANRMDGPLVWAVGVHPVLEGVDLSPLRIERSAVLDLAPGDVTIVASSAGPVGVASTRDGARRVSFGFRAEASTLPLEAAFPLLVRNALRWVADPPAAPPYVVAGEPLPGGDGAVVPLPPPGGPHLLRLPDGSDTVVRWIPSPPLRLSAPVPAALPPDRAIAAIADRGGDRDTRRRHGPALALAGAAALVLWALALSFAAAGTTGGASAAAAPR